jgi:autotransporter passenger strand-loop-strand repeat protein
MSVFSGATANSTMVNSDGRLEVFSGATANSTTVNEGGNMSVSNGGMANSTMVYDGGCFYISSGGTATNIIASSMAYLGLTIAPDTFIQGTSRSVDFEINNAFLSGYTIDFGEIHVSSGGTADHTTVTPGGSLYVSCGGTANSIVENGGYVDIVEDANVTFISNSFSGLILSNGATVHSGTTANSTTVDSGGSLTVSIGGIANNTTVSSGGRLYVSSGGTALNIVWTPCNGHVFVSDGGYATFVSEYSGVYFGSDNYLLSNTAIMDGMTISSTCEMNVMSGGTANSTTVNSAGNMYISSGGNVNYTIINGGKLYVSSGGTANNTTFTDEYYYSEMYVSNGGTANSTTVTIKGLLRVSSGGTVNSTAVYSGGIMFISSGGSAVSTTVNSRGSMFVSGGGTVNSTTVTSDGRLHLFSGGKATGKMLFERGAGAKMDEGSILDFDLTSTSAGAAALVNDLSRIQGTPLYTLTVDMELKPGSYSYLLADGAAGFNGTISVMNKAGESFGTLTVGETLKAGYSDYTLNLNDNSLSVSVEVPDLPPTISDVRSDITTPTNRDVTVTAVFADDAGVSESLYRFGEDGEWLAYPADGVTVTENMTVYFKAVDTAGNESEIVSCEVKNIDKMKPVITLTGDNQTPLQKATLTATVDDGSPIYYRIGDSEDWKEYTAPITVTDNATYNFLSTDAAGNEGTNFLSFNNIDTVAPVITLTGDNLMPLQEATITASTDDGSPIYYMIGDSGEWKEYTAPITVTDNATYNFLSVDAVGNEGTNFLSFANIDRNPPPILLIADTETPLQSSTITASTEEGLDLYYSTDQENWVKYEAPIDVTENGTYYFKATDAAGNEGTNFLSFANIRSDEPAPAKNKWTYMVYMAADSNIGDGALYDIIGMQQAKVDSEIDIYVLADRCPVDAGYPVEVVTVNGTYEWDSLWPETRVGRITCSPGLTVTVDWESWGELDTASVETLKRFVDWAQEQSPADNYGLILWDHGGENAALCWDITTDPNWNAYFTISEVSALLKEKGNIPIVIFNNCLLASEIVATQMAGSTEVIVASEPVSMSESTYNYNAFFNTITADMTPQEMAEIMVQNVVSPGMLTMLSSIDVTDSRLGDALEALADAVAEAGNDADKAVLTNAMLKAHQDGFCYSGSYVQQSDLGDMIRQAMADGSYDKTSEGFKKALADVKTVLEEVVLAFRSVPVNRGTGIAYCNTIATILQCYVTGRTPEKTESLLQSHITSSYKSNPLWGGLLYDLGTTYWNQNKDQLFRPASFDIIDVEGLVDGRTIAAMDLGCFSGKGEQNYGIALIGDAFCRIVITDEDKSTGTISVANEIGKEIKVSLLASDGSVVVAETNNGIAFENLAPDNYYIRLRSETNCDVTVTFDANWMTGVDRFDYAGSGQNLPGVNGNGSINTATVLDAGYYTGLLTSKGDTDFYRIGNIHTEQYTVVINGAADWIVAEYDENGNLVRKGQYSELDNIITLTMDSMNYLLVEGTADLSKPEVNRYFLNVFKNENGSGDVVQLDNLTGSKDEVSWESSAFSEYIVECSPDNFGHVLEYATRGTAVDLLNLPAGTYRWRVKANVENAEWNDGNEIVSDNASAVPKVFRSKADASDDIFFATPNGEWSSLYYAQHAGSFDDWTGTNEIVSANGKGRIQDLFFGSADPSTLCLTDAENGDALFLDDVYTGLPEEIEENTGRLFRLQMISAGAGDDIVDMTSQRFEYSDGKLSIFGGDGDDIIWASRGKNSLYGDAGNDRIVGASGDDMIVGGIGNDRMHGGGGDDIFTFCANWGIDEVEQLDAGSVTLWFVSGSLDNWDEATLTYTDSDNSVKVSGVTADKVTLKFGDDDSAQFASLTSMGAFFDATSERIFEESGKGMLASL